MRQKRKKFAKEFKLEAVKMVVEQGFKRSDVAERLGINEGSLGNWISAYKENGKDSFPGNGRLLPQDEELRKLRAENKRLRMERDILKKAAIFFAEHEK
jgi:transposase